MDVITIIGLIILGFILDILSKKYVKTTMVLNTAFIIGLILILDFAILMFITGLSNELPLMLKLFLIIIALLPIVFMSEYIGHTIRILDYSINKSKLLERGHIQKGIIKEIRSYGWRRRHIGGYYLIVDFNGEEIKSIPFKYHRGGTMVKTTYTYTDVNGKFSKDKREEVLENAKELYNIGDEIDVIVYKNKKYVKLKE